MKDFENAFTRDELIELLDDPETPRVSTGTVRELIRSLIAEMDKQKEGHDLQFPGQLYDLDEIKKAPVPSCRCNTIPAPESQPDWDADLKALAEKEAGKC